jgi:predicted phosphodiesterase
VNAVWGLISDVHGNLPALERALQVLQTAGATKLGFLGDYLGRGDSDACIRRIRDVADLAVVGNRDLDWQDRVSHESKAYVLSLPRTAQAGKLLLSHGDPRLTPALSTAQISRHFARSLTEMDVCGAQVWAFGHSHQARIWCNAQPAATECTTMQEGSTYCINVGTTGLPFPGKGGPSVALVDFIRNEIRQLPLEQD